MYRNFVHDNQKRKEKRTKLVEVKQKITKKNRLNERKQKYSIDNFNKINRIQKLRRNSLHFDFGYFYYDIVSFLSFFHNIEKQAIVFC